MHGRKIGPDPASIATCQIGGIAANNASGMCCGTAQNSYRTVRAMKLVLADGTFLDTGDPASRAAFAASHAPLLAGVSALRREILADAPLARRIREKYRIKNTTGYGLNSFVDFDDPVDVLLHLMVGSEGTLGFMAEVTFETVEEHAHKASALVLFPDVETAARGTQRLSAGVVAAVELMDRASLRAVEGKPGLPPVLSTLPPDTCALLVEVRAADPADLAGAIGATTALLEGLPVLEPIAFTAVKAEYERLWDVRRGLFPAIGAARRVGTTVVIEDVAFPMEHLAAGTVELQRLFAAHGYTEGIIFGHALDGNLHFVFTQGFSDPGRGRPLRALHGRGVRAGRGPVPRLAEGRARHRPEHGAVRRARVGGAGDRDHAAPQGAPGSGRNPESGRHPERRSRRPSETSEGAPARARPRRPLHGVRLLRAALPLARAHAHAAAAHHRPARDRAAR